MVKNWNSQAGPNPTRSDPPLVRPALKQRCFCNVIANPAWYLPSWLTNGEFLECVKHSEIEHLNIKVHAAVAMMDLIESRGYTARMVFWFDV